MNYELVPVGLMNVDLSYQRTPEEPRIRKISSGWDDNKANVIHLSQRKDGSKWVIDGNHTRLACERVYGKEHELLCNIHTGLSVKEEAELFVALNKAQKKPSFNETLKASLAAGDQIAVGYINALEEAGLKYSLSKSKNRQDEYRAHNSLISIYKLTPYDLFVRSVKVAISATDGREDFLKVGLFPGLCSVVVKHPEINDNRLINIIKKTPIGKIIDIANLYKDGSLSGGVSTTIYFRKAYIDLYNKGLRNKKIVEENK